MIPQHMSKKVSALLSVCSRLEALLKRYETIKLALTTWIQFSPRLTTKTDLLSQCVMGSYLLLAPMVLTSSFAKSKPLLKSVSFFTLLEASITNTRSSPPFASRLMALPRISIPGPFVLLHPVAFSLLHVYSNKGSIRFFRKLYAVVLTSLKRSSNSSAREYFSKAIKIRFYVHSVLRDISSQFKVLINGDSGRDTKASYQCGAIWFK